MDQESFDRLARVLAAAGTRRAALGALLGAAAAGSGSLAQAAKPARRRRERGGNSSKSRTPGRVSAQAATCGNPGPSANLNGCDFSGDDLAGVNLFASSMVGANFTNANLCSANLRSSQLRNAVFKGANLTNADLRSSACKGTQFNEATVFCNTRVCNGSIRNDDCPIGVAPGDVCCDSSDCELGQACSAGVCQGLAAVPFGTTEVTADGDVRLVSDLTTATPYGGLEFSVGGSVDFAEIVRLEAVYHSEVAPGCRAGSPRFELATRAGSVFVYFSPDDECTTEPNETPNFIGIESDVHYDTSRIAAGTERTSYFATRALLQERELPVTRIALVVDGGRTGNPQRVRVTPRVDVQRGNSA